MHIFSASHFFFFVNQLWLLSLAIKAVTPLALGNKSNLSDIGLLRNNVAVVYVVFRVGVASGHETKRNLIGERGVEVVSNLEEIGEGSLLKDIFVQKLSHNVVLDLERNRLKVFKLLT